MELDSLDKKLLCLLDANGRATCKKLAKASRSSPEVVRYRVNRLLEKGIIRNFMALLNFSEFGFVGHGVFCRIISEKKKGQAINYLKAHPRVYWIAEFGGRYDLAFAVLAKDSLEFYSILGEIKENTSGALSDWDIAIRMQLTQFPRGYLLNAHPKRKSSPPHFGRELRHHPISKTDFEILKAISQNGRMGPVELSRSLGIPPSTIAFRMKKLAKERVLQGVSPQTICQEFGYQSFQLFLSVENPDSQKRRKLFNYCQDNPNVIFFVEVLGKWSFELIYETKDEKEFQKELVHLRETFPWISGVEIGIIFDHFVKYDHFPVERKDL